MRFPLFLAAALAGSSFSASAGTPQQADGIRRAYEADFQIWVKKLQIAASPDERTRIAQERPDAVAVAKRLWTAIQPNLADEWSLEPLAWLLNLSSGLVVRQENGLAQPLAADWLPVIRTAVSKHHLKSQKLVPLCMALVSARDQALLEKIDKENPDKEIQGVAALGIAMLMKDLSDEPEVMRRRLTLLKKAIIESSDVEINGVTVAKLAEDELYIIRFLSKGREAPDLTGTGSGGEPMRLSNYKGKVIVLLFWRSDDGSSEQLIEMTKAMRERFSGKPFEIVGVNRDQQPVLRQLQASGQIAWPNFSDPEGKLASEYRVGSWPVAYVLDGDRKIHYVGGMGSFVELTAAAVLQEK